LKVERRAAVAVGVEDRYRDMRAARAGSKDLGVASECRPHPSRRILSFSGRLDPPPAPLFRRPPTVCSPVRTYARLQAAHEAETLKREALYQGRMVEEVDRYTALSADVDALRAAWAAKRAATTADTDGRTSSLLAGLEARLGAARARRAELEREVAGVKRDWEEGRRQQEEDLDSEIENARGGYEARLTTEREAALRFKGENGVMKKKLGTLLREIEDGKVAVKASLDAADARKRTIAALEREIGLLRGAIREKDAAITDRERRIYELKKKNQVRLVPR
jgi:chromosome segregation ATPase